MVTENRRYYWLQLKEDFFNSKEMKLMRKLPGGEEITIIYLKMMLVSLAEQGKLYFEGLAEDLAEELSLIIDEDPEAIRLALMFLTKKKLLTTSDNYQFNLEQVPEMIGSETASARRVRKHRENQKTLQCNTDVTKCNGDIDIVIIGELTQGNDNEQKEIKVYNKAVGSPFKVVAFVKDSYLWFMLSTSSNNNDNLSFDTYVRLSNIDIASKFMPSVLKYTVQDPR